MGKKEPKAEELRSDDLKVRVTRSPGCQVLLEVEISPAGCAKHYETALKRVRKQVSIPGFRKGKVPIDRVKRQFGEAIRSEWEEVVVRAVFGEALGLCKILPWKREEAATPKLESLSLEEGGSVSYSYESQPEIPLFSRDDLKLSVPEEKPVTDSDIEEGLAELRELWPNFEAVEERAAQLGDTVHIDVEHLEGETPTLVFENRAIALREEEQEQWLQKLLIGAETGATIEGSPDEASGGNYRVTVRQISQRHPATDEQLLQHTGTKDLGELRERIRRDKEQTEKRRVRAEVLQQLWDTLYQEVPFELPASLVEGERQTQLQQRVRALKAEDLSDEEILSQESNLAAEVDSQVSKQFHKLFFALHVADEASCRPSDEEVRERLNVVLNLRAVSGGQPLSTQDEFAALSNKIYLELVAEKAEDWLLEKILPRKAD